MSTIESLPLAAADVDGGRRCAVCEHDVVDHDAIGLRYCRATQALVLSRHCVCRTAG